MVLKKRERLAHKNALHVVGSEYIFYSFIHSFKVISKDLTFLVFFCILRTLRKPEIPAHIFNIKSYVEKSK